MDVVLLIGGLGGFRVGLWAEVVLVVLFPPPPGLRVDVVDVVLLIGGLGGFRTGLGRGSARRSLPGWGEVVDVHLLWKLS